MKICLRKFKYIAIAQWKEWRWMDGWYNQKEKIKICVEVFEEFGYGSVWFSSNEGIRVKEDLTCSLRCYVKGRDSLLVTNELINHIIIRHPST